MPVRFAVHEIARASYLAWRGRLSSGGPGGRELSGTYAHALRDELIRTAGRPAGARFLARIRPPLGIWEYQFGETWVVYVVQRLGGFWRRLVGRSDLRVTLVAVYD